MRLRSKTILWVLLGLEGCAASQSFAAVEPAAIRVRISANEAFVKETVEKTVKIRGFDLRISREKGAVLLPLASGNKRSAWELKCQKGQILLQSLQAKPQLYQVSGPVSVRSRGGFIYYGENPYRDELKIYPIGDRCEVVNVLALEKYLDGLVNAEFSSQWNEEAIEAQVIAARTYAFYQIQEAKSQKNSHFDLDATVKDQVYKGSLQEDHHSSQAAKKTQGMVLTAEGGKKIYPLKAFYHSTCGGRTELPQNVWGKASPGFNKKVSCPFCSSSPRFHWALELQTQDISRAIAEGFKSEGSLPKWPKQSSQILQQNQLLNVRVTQLDREGRVAQISTAWADGKKVVELPISGAKFRDWLGAGRFRSTWFQVQAGGKGQGSTWRFQGRGNGHGVGLCQWGAKTMGEKGFKMASILKHYYPDAALRKLW